MRGNHHKKCCCAEEPLNDAPLPCERAAPPLSQGTHALVVLVDSIRRPLDTLYLHAALRKCRPVAKLKAVGVTAVAWNRAQGAQLTTGSIIVGSSVGNIYEVALDEKAREALLL